MKRLRVHPLADLVPPSGQVSVRDAIEKPILLLDGELADGRGRVREAIRLGLPCPYVDINAARDDHPALILARAMTARVPQPDAYVRAVVCARLVRAILLRPDWLERYDAGAASRLKYRKNLAGMLDACAISITTYDRAHKVLRDPVVETAVVAGLLPLKTADRLMMVADATRRERFVRMPDDERAIALDRYFARAGKRRAVQKQRTFEGMFREVMHRHTRNTGDE
ncbi:hypothetical protein [Paraburkholderia mimosarum]|uniref:hypothetical protein n=1 Tax=Paraburkholderia mimosarum TaxID=312026 RepID=UPI000481F21A|nr:hypothetical protein [Paraburkholderia mimosarum]